jgi:hypothetical protein
MCWGHPSVHIVARPSHSFHDTHSSWTALYQIEYVTVFRCQFCQNRSHICIMEQPVLVTTIFDTDSVSQWVKCLLDGSAWKEPRLGSRLDNQGLIVWFLAGESNYVLVKCWDWFCSPQTLLLNGYWNLYSCNIKLNARLPVVSHAFIASTETTLYSNQCTLSKGHVNSVQCCYVLYSTPFT